MRSEVLVSLLVSGVLGDEVKVFSADDECAVHLGGNDGAGQDTSTDGDETSKWALLVCENQTSASYLPLPCALCPRRSVKDRDSPGHLVHQPVAHSFIAIAIAS